MAAKKTTKAKKPKKTAVKSVPAAQQKKFKKPKRHHLKHHPILTLMRIVKNGFKNLWRNAWLSVAATTIMAVTLTTILLATLANKALNETIDEFSQDLTLSVYLLDDATNDRQVELRDELQTHPLVTGLEYISKDEARKGFDDTFKEEESLIAAFDILEENPFPASFRLNIGDLERIDELVEFAEAENFEDVVDETSNNNDTAKEAIDLYTEQQRLIIATGIVVASVFAVISVMVIFNTIRLAIYSRADEVRNMKLLGASHGYIRGPFLFEASMYGVISGLISFGFVALALKKLIPRLIENSFTAEGILDTLNKFAVPFYDNNWELILVACVGGGVLIGFISSAIALSRYMKY